MSFLTMFVEVLHIDMMSIESGRFSYQITTQTNQQL